MLDYKVLEKKAIERRKESSKERRRESNRIAQHSRRTFQFLWILMGS
jgi:hypothetical protein